MISGDLKTEAPYKPDGRWEGPAGTILVEVTRTSSMRDVRGVLLMLTYLVQREPVTAQAVCLLIDSRLSDSRLHDELHQFRQVVHPAIADRIHFLAGKSAAIRKEVTFSGSLQNASSDFYKWLEKLIATERQRGYAPQLPARQTVVAALAQMRLWNQSPVTVKHLQQTCGVSYPTVAAVLKGLAEKDWLEDSGERGVRLRPLTIGEWMDLARDHARQRKVHLFTDPTGHSSPEQMAKRLARLQAANKLPRGIRIGGVLGASRHFPELDITTAPRLDLSVDEDPVQVAELLDAGLQPKTRPEQRVALAVHVSQDPWVIADVGAKDQGQWAGELECLADLIEMGFSREASELAHHMELTNKQGKATA